MYSSRFYVPNDNILDYLLYTRQSGHTTLSIQGAKNYDKPFYIVGIDQRHASNLSQEIKNKNGIPTSFQSFTHKTYFGKNLPAFIDNGTLIHLLSEHQETIDKFKELINKIDEDTLEYDQENIKVYNLMVRNSQKQVSRIRNLSLWNRLFNYKKIIRNFNIEINYPKSYIHTIYDIERKKIEDKKMERKWYNF